MKTKTELNFRNFQMDHETSTLRLSQLHCIFKESSTENAIAKIQGQIDKDPEQLEVIASHISNEQLIAVLSCLPNLKKLSLKHSFVNSTEEIHGRMKSVKTMEIYNSLGFNCLVLEELEELVVFSPFHNNRMKLQMQDFLTRKEMKNLKLLMIDFCPAIQPKSCSFQLQSLVLNSTEGDFLLYRQLLHSQQSLENLSINIKRSDFKSPEVLIQVLKAICSLSKLRELTIYLAENDETPQKENVDGIRQFLGQFRFRSTSVACFAINDELNLSGSIIPFFSSATETACRFYSYSGAFVVSGNVFFNPERFESLNIQGSLKHFDYSPSKAPGDPMKFQETIFTFLNRNSSRLSFIKLGHEDWDEKFQFCPKFCEAVLTQFPCLEYFEIFCAPYVPGPLKQNRNQLGKAIQVQFNYKVIEQKAKRMKLE